MLVPIQPLQPVISVPIVSVSKNPPNLTVSHAYMGGLPSSLPLSGAKSEEIPSFEPKNSENHRNFEGKTHWEKLHRN